MKLDETLRARIRALAESETHTLDDSARAQVLRAVRVEHGRTSATRPWLWAAALAGLLLVLARLAQVAPQQTAAPGSLQTPRPPAPRAAPAALATSEPCRARDAQFTTAAGGARTLDLGRLALLSAKPGTELTTRSASACGIALELSAGALAVHARELAGTTLTVHTALGDVSVHGTVFEVRVAADGRALRVHVDEGVVLFTGRAGERLFVPAARALTVEAGGRARVHALAPQARRALRRVLGLAPHVRTSVAPAQPSAPVLAPTATESDRVWREGELPAPHIAPEPGSSITEDGRPMHKPRVNP
jgi:hypothetical protein